MLALLVIVAAVVAAFGLGWFARGRVRRYLPGTVHMRYHVDTSQAVAAIRALDDLAKRTGVMLRPSDEASAVPIRFDIAKGGDA